MNEGKYELIIYWDSQDAIYVAEVPELPGCMAHGSTRSESVKQAELAIAAWILSSKENGKPIPEPKGKLLFK